MKELIIGLVREINPKIGNSSKMVEEKFQEIPITVYVNGQGNYFSIDIHIDKIKGTLTLNNNTKEKLINSLEFVDFTKLVKVEGK